MKLAMTWNLTTHKVDPNVDEARDYIMSDLLESGHVDRVGLVGGVGESTADNPRKNLGNDPYVTDGKRAVLILSKTKTQAKLLRWKAQDCSPKDAILGIGAYIVVAKQTRSLWR